MQEEIRWISNKKNCICVPILWFKKCPPLYKYFIINLMIYFKVIVSHFGPPSASATHFPSREGIIITNVLHILPEKVSHPQHCWHLGMDKSLLWGCLVCCRMVSSILNLYPLEANTPSSSVVIIKIPPNNARCPPGGQNDPGGEPRFQRCFIMRNHCAKRWRQCW